jgi:RNA polymerase sigma factor (sigma-70 family)
MLNKSKTLNRISLESLYLELEKPLFNLVFRYLWNKEEAQDLVQEAFVKLWKIKDKVEIKTVKPLIYKICINLAVTKNRRKKILNFFSLDKLSNEPFDEHNDSLEQKEEIQLLKKIINELPVKLKQTVLLTEFSDMSYEEVGKALGTPAGTVGSRKNKAISILKEKFNKIYG